jgi:hypothetical protein
MTFDANSNAVADLKSQFGMICPRFFMVSLELAASLLAMLANIIVAFKNRISPFAILFPTACSLIWSMFSAFPTGMVFAALPAGIVFHDFIPFWRTSRFLDSCTQIRQINRVLAPKLSAYLLFKFPAWPSASLLDTLKPPGFIFWILIPLKVALAYFFSGFLRAWSVMSAAIGSITIAASGNSIIGYKLTAINAFVFYFYLFAITSKTQPFLAFFLGRDILPADMTMSAFVFAIFAISLLARDSFKWFFANFAMSEHRLPQQRSPRRPAALLFR